MEPRTIIFIFCIIDVILGFWCLYLSIQNIKMEKEKEKFKNGKQ